MWQVDFTNLNWTVQGGTLYAFFVGATPGAAYFGDGPFLSASNAALSGSPQQGADNLMWYLGQDASTGAVNHIGQRDSNAPNPWDRSSDVAWRFFATPEPSSLLFLGTILSKRIAFEWAARHLFLNESWAVTSRAKAQMGNKNRHTYCVRIFTDQPLWPGAYCFTPLRSSQQIPASSEIWRHRRRRP